MIMEVASGTGEVPEALGTTRESQRKLLREVSPGGWTGFPRQRKGRPDFQAKERNALSFILSQNISLSPSVGKAWS